MRNRFALTPLAAALLAAHFASHAQDTGTVQRLPEVNVTASADASAGGLKPAYAGGQVARGGRVGILGSGDIMDTPFSITNYTQKLIQDQQAQSIGDVLQNDPAVRIARGFGNYQQVYFVRGLPVFSDDMAYNGLYGLLPRQYLAAELVERVEVLRGASAFLNGASPGGSGLGGAVNVSPKRATNQPLSELTLGVDDNGSGYVAADLARRFGPDRSVGARLNVVHRDGRTEVNDAKRKLDLVSLGLDYRASNLRVSADIAYQDYQLRGAQPSVSVAAGLAVPKAPDASRNLGQFWTHSNERDTLGTVRAEYDLNSAWTVWGAYGMRNGDESNDLAGATVKADAIMNYLRSINTRTDRISTGEVGVRGKFSTGAVSHAVVLSAATYRAKLNAPFDFAAFAGVDQGFLYAPAQITPIPALGAFPGTTISETKTSSLAIADTLGFMQDTLLVTLGARKQKFEDPFQGYSQSRVTPIGGVVWKVNKMVSVYGTYVEGLVKGDIAPATFGFAPAQPVVNAGAVLKPYQTKQTEFGVKFDGGTIGATFNVYQAKKPVFGVDPTSLVFQQVDRQTNKGAELSVFGEPMTGVRVLGGASFLDAKMSNGTRPIGTPKSQFNLGAEWDVAALNGLTVDGRFVQTASQFNDSANTQVVPSWHRFDLGARYVMDIGSRQLTLRARIENVANKDYWASTGGFPGFGYLVLGLPRTFTVSGTVSF